MQRLEADRPVGKRGFRNRKSPSANILQRKQIQEKNTCNNATSVVATAWLRPQSQHPPTSPSTSYQIAGVLLFFLLFLFLAPRIWQECSKSILFSRRTLSQLFTPKGHERLFRRRHRVNQEVRPLVRLMRHQHLHQLFPSSGPQAQAANCLLAWAKG